MGTKRKTVKSRFTLQECPGFIPSIVLGPKRCINCGSLREKHPEAGIEPTKQAEADFLEPIVKGLNGHRGARKKLLELLSERAGKTIIPGRITRWLRPEIAKRESPILGIGLLLRETFDQHKNEICRPQKMPYWSRRPDGGKKKKPTKTKAKMK